MKIKSYYAATIAEAIDNARRELGPEAMILASRRTSGETAHLGQYEVVFGTNSAEPTKPLVENVKAPTPPAPPAPVQDEGMARLRKHVDSLRSNIRRKTQIRKEPTRPQIQLHVQLVAEGLHPEIASEIASAVKVRLGVAGQQDVSPETVSIALARELQGRLQAAPVLGRPRVPRKIVALVGPPGAGKTSTLVKLAVRYGLAAGLPTRLLSADTYRLGASDRLQTYAASMGVSLELTESADVMEAAIDSHKGKGLLLIDTPGYSPHNIGQSEQFASLLSKHPETDVHLVLPAYMTSRDMARTADAYRAFLPSKLIFTKLDEAGSAGPVISELLRQEKPISFIGTGQQVPEGLEAASVERLLENFMPVRNVEAVSAA